MSRQRRGEAERHRVDERAQIGVGSEPLGVHPAERGEKAEVVEPLLFRGAEEEVAASHLEDPGGVVVAVRVETEGRRVVEVLHEPRVVEVDRHRQRRRGQQEVVGELPLRHRRGAVAHQLGERRAAERPDGLRSEPRRGALLPARRRDQDRLETRGGQAPGELQVADADPRHARAHRLARKQRDPAHRPRRVSQRCTRQARVASMLAMRPLSRSISA